MEREPPTIPVRLTVAQIDLLVKVCDRYRPLPEDPIQIDVPLRAIKRQLAAALDRI
jgi:hypothetical protein